MLCFEIVLKTYPKTAFTIKLRETLCTLRLPTSHGVWAMLTLQTDIRVGLIEVRHAEVEQWTLSARPLHPTRHISLPPHSLTHYFLWQESLAHAAPLRPQHSQYCRLNTWLTPVNALLSVVISNNHEREELQHVRTVFVSCVAWGEDAYVWTFLYGLLKILWNKSITNKKYDSHEI